MKKGTKIFISVFLAITIILSALLWWWCGFFYSTNSYFYKQVSNSEYNALPTIESLPEHRDVKYKYFKDYMGVWESEAYTMIVEYDDETYNNQKNVVCEPFEALTDWTDFDENDYPIVKKVTSGIELNGFSFKMYSTDYPHKIFFIGANDDANQIAYIYFEDHDLDSISEPYSDFIDKSCGW